MGGNRSAISDAQLETLHQQLQQQSNGVIPQNFASTAQGHDPKAPKIRAYMPQKSIRNPQTEQFLDMLGLPYNLDHQAPVAPSAMPSSKCSMLQQVWLEIKASDLAMLVANADEAKALLLSCLFLMPPFREAQGAFSGACIGVPHQPSGHVMNDP